MPTIVEHQSEFRERHSKDFVRIDNGRVELFADGAKIEHRPYFDDLMIEPPTDRKALLELRRHYRQVKVEIFMRGFEGLKKALTGATPIAWRWDEEALGAPPDDRRDGKAALLALKSRATRHREMIAAINAEIDALPEVVSERQRASELAAMNEEIRRENEYAVAEIKAIEW